MEVIPAVDVLDGRVVRLTRGDYQAATIYADDPVATARAWIDQGAPLVHVVDLVGARSGRPDSRLWRRMAEAGLPFQVGGGLRTPQLVVEALESGARRVVVGTAAVWDPVMLERLVEDVGGEHVVAAIDLRGDRATGWGWTDKGRPIGDVLPDVLRSGVPRLMVTATSKDGTLDGPDLDLLKGVIAAAPGLAILASGGVGSLGDLEALGRLGVEGTVVGRAIYERRFTLAEAKAAAR
jgi:phosphoribosylformimino-5-aminoimidazole carboxamide ribotide isomerase